VVAWRASDLTIHLSRTRFVASFKWVLALFFPNPVCTLQVGLLQALALMRKDIAVVALLAVSSGCAAQDAFQDAPELARQIISAELEGQFCKPSPIPELQRRAMTNALARIDRSGLSDPTGLSPLNLAVISDDIPTMKRLSSLGYALDSPDSTLLHDAVFHNSKRVLSFLLANGADPNAANS